MGAGALTADLSRPASIAPTNMRTPEFAVKISCVQLLEKFFQIKMAPLRTRGSRADAPAPHVINAFARAVRARIFQVRRRQARRRPAPIYARRQHPCRSLPHA